MNNLSNYFKKFTQSISPDRIIRERCIEAVSLYTGHTIDKQAIHVSKDKVFLTLHPTRKYHILQNKEAIMRHINNNSFGFKISILG